MKVEFVAIRFTLEWETKGSLLERISHYMASASNVEV
jgi:hypothetical protein